MMTQQIHKTHSVFSTLSLVVGILTLLVILTLMISGAVNGQRGSVATSLLVVVPVCSLGVALAIFALVWRQEDKRLGTAGLWLNGLMAFLAFPVMVLWLLGI